MKQNHPIRAMEALRNCNASLLSNAKFSKTYTTLSKAANSFGLGHSILHQKQPFLLNFSNTSCNKHDSIDIPSSVIKKRNFLSDLKAELVSLRDSCSVLKSQSHSISLYLKKSELLGNDCESLVSCKIMEMEIPIIKVLIRLSKNYQELMCNLQDISCRQIRLDTQKRQCQERIKALQTTLKKDLIHPKKKILQKDGPSSAFRKFKEQQQAKSLEKKKELELYEARNREDMEKIETQVKSLKQELIRVENEKLKLVDTIEFKNYQIKGLNISKSKLQSENDELKQLLHTRTEEIEILSESLGTFREMSKYKEMWQMACEQLHTFKIYRKDDQLELNRLNKKYRIVKDRLSSLMQNKYVEIPQDCGREREELTQILYSVNQWSGFTKAALQGIQQSEVEKTLSQAININVLQKSLEEYKKGLPSFYCFLQNHQERITYQFKQLKNRNVNKEYFLQMRAILDSKYLDFWYDDYARKLPDFAIGFLQKNQICKINKKIIQNNSSAESIQNTKVNFFLDMLNPKLKDVWECDMFRMFLMEEYSQDQLFFYLSCRHYLFSGNLLQHLIYNSDPIIFITLQKAVKALEQILIRYDRSVVEKVKFCLQMKKKCKNNRYYIDSHFLLKVLLDIYSSERQRRLHFYETVLSNLQSKNQRGEKHIHFKNFKRFMAVNYQFMTMAEIAEMYRQCYNISKGQVTYSVVFAHASDRLFVRQLKQTPLMHQLKGNMMMALSESMINLHSSIEDCRYMDKTLYQLGLQQIHVNLQELKRCTNINIGSQLSPNNVLCAIRHQNLLSKVLFMEFLRRTDSGKSQQPIERHILRGVKWNIQQIRSLFDVNQAKENERAGLRKAARMLCLAFRKKIQKIYEQFDKDINQKLIQLSK